MVLVRTAGRSGTSVTCIRVALGISKPVGVPLPALFPWLLACDPRDEP